MPDTWTHVLPFFGENPYELCYHYLVLPVAHGGWGLGPVCGLGSLYSLSALGSDSNIRDRALNTTQLSLSLAFMLSRICL